MNNPLLNYLSTRVALIASLIARSAVRYRSVKEIRACARVCVLDVIDNPHPYRSTGGSKRRRSRKASGNSAFPEKRITGRPAHVLDSFSV
jgi:hypothetical protein